MGIQRELRKLTLRFCHTSIFDYFRPDPTRDWPECRQVPLVYDLARRELNGIPFGALADRLRSLGRPSNRKPIWNGSFAYPRLGIEIGLVRRERVDTVMCAFQAKLGEMDIDQHPEFRPCEIELRRGDGTTGRLTSGADREEVELLFGPLAVERTEYVVAEGVRVDGVWLGFEFGPDGRLRILDIEPEPPAAS